MCVCAGYSSAAWVCTVVAYCSRCVLVMGCCSTRVCWLWVVAARVCADVVNYSTCMCWFWFVAPLMCADLINYSSCVCAGYGLLQHIRMCANMINYSMWVCWLYIIATWMHANMVDCSTCMCWYKFDKHECLLTSEFPCSLSLKYYPNEAVDNVTCMYIHIFMVRGVIVGRLITFNSTWVSWLWFFAAQSCVCADMVNYSTCVCWLRFVPACVYANMVNHSMLVCWLCIAAAPVRANGW